MDFNEINDAVLSRKLEEIAKVIRRYDLSDVEIILDGITFKVKRESLALKSIGKSDALENYKVKKEVGDALNKGVIKTKKVTYNA